METIIKIQLPLKRIPKPTGFFLSLLPWHKRLIGNLFTWGGGSIQEFGGKKINQTRYLAIFRWHILTVHRNEYHDRSDKERADEYLSKWSACEKELSMFRLHALGQECDQQVRDVIKESLGVNLDEGTID